MNDFLNSEQKLIYAEMSLNNFLNNAEQKIILCSTLEICKKQWIIFMRKQWIALLNKKNRFYEYSKQIQIYTEHDGQSANFNNVEADFINAEK